MNGRRVAFALSNDAPRTWDQKTAECQTLGRRLKRRPNVIGTSSQWPYVARGGILVQYAAAESRQT
ncbi:MAG: hypothetical protein JWO59_3355 [Chloroflexi bacterium]|nr:hypothetical protein [Chloroflexota bacterium]